MHSQAVQQGYILTQATVSSAAFSFPKPASYKAAVQQQTPVDLFLSDFSIQAFIYLFFLLSTCG